MTEICFDYLFNVCSCLSTSLNGGGALQRTVKALGCEGRGLLFLK